MKHLPRPFIALIAALLLVFAQQAALAHMIGHTGVAAQASLSQNEDSHNAALSLSHTCTACIAFAALDAFVPSVTLPLPAATEQVGIRTAPLPLALARQHLTAQARAPPFSL